MNRGVWQVIVHGVTKSRTRLSDWTTTNNTFNPHNKPVKLILLALMGSVGEGEGGKIWENGIET